MRIKRRIIKMVQKYSLKIDGEKLITKNFKVREFRCRDGADEIFIDLRLVDILQKVRDHFNKPVVVTSGYRTENHNKNVGGAKNSYHLLGKAADLFINGVKAEEIAKFLANQNILGIGLYINRSQEFVHVDTRSLRYWWIQDGSKSAKQVAKF